jgi:hypothetical protein
MRRTGRGRSDATGPAIVSAGPAREITNATAGVHRGARERGDVAADGRGSAGRPHIYVDQVMKSELTNIVCSTTSWEEIMQLDRRNFLQVTAGAMMFSASPHITEAQSSSEAGSKKGTRVITLGTRSGPTPDLYRAQCRMCLSQMVLPT